MEIFDEAARRAKQAKKLKETLSQQGYPEIVIRAELEKVKQLVPVCQQGDVIHFFGCLLPEKYLMECFCLPGSLQFEAESFLEFHDTRPFIGTSGEFVWDVQNFDKLKKVAASFSLSVRELPPKGFPGNNHTGVFGLVNRDNKIMAVVITYSTECKNIWIALDCEYGGKLLEDLAKDVFFLRTADKIKFYTHEEWDKVRKRSIKR